MSERVPLERDWKHWKEKFEMEQRYREQDRDAARRQIELWMQHAITLGRVLDKFMSDR